MTTARLTELLEAIRNGVDPTSGERFNKQESCLANPDVRKSLNRVIRSLVVKPDVQAVDEQIKTDIPDAIIKEVCGELRSLGYQPSVMQVAKVFIGSRSIVDRNLKSLTSYNRYRGVHTRQRIHDHLMDFSRREAAILPELPKRTERTITEPWREINFFRSDAFHKLDADKEKELKQAVADLGLRKDTNKLPQYMVQARQTYPRSFEPWNRSEQAILIEAMCYTNDLDKLALLFGRSSRSIEAMGQRLIWDSREKRA